MGCCCSSVETEPVGAEYVGMWRLNDTAGLLARDGHRPHAVINVDVDGSVDIGLTVWIKPSKRAIMSHPCGAEMVAYRIVRPPFVHEGRVCMTLHWAFGNAIVEYENMTPRVEQQQQSVYDEQASLISV
jgi:hypothetical protein